MMVTESPATELPFKVLTKNTFIEMRPVQEERRCGSVPASSRLAGLGLQDRCEVSAKTSPRLSVGASCEDGSTEAGTDSASAASDEDLASMALASASMPAMGSADQASDAKAALASWLPGIFSGENSDIAGGCPPPPPHRGKLSSRAKAWTPLVPATPGGARPVDGRFRYQCGFVADYVKVALTANACAVSAEAVEGPHGWAIKVHVRAKDLCHKEWLLLQAKEALLRAAERSDNVYVMGYRARPFVSTLPGFDAKLGAMVDTDKACWDVFAQGYCGRGASCRWQHPEQTATLNVMVKLIE